MVCNGPDELAFVLSHEIAHVLASHVYQRKTISLLIKAIIMAPTLNLAPCPLSVIPHMIVFFARPPIAKLVSLAQYR